MALDDRTRWNQRYRAMATDRRPHDRAATGEVFSVGPARQVESAGDVGGAEEPAARPLLHLAGAWLPYTGQALDLACGAGREAVWLAHRGLEVIGIDIAEEGLALAAAHAERHGVARRVRLVAADLDDGLPPGCEGPFDVIVACHFRSAILEEAVRTRLRQGGVVVASRLSMVGRSGAAVEQAFLAEPGELAALARRSGLVIHHHEEADGAAALVAQRL